MMKSLLIANRGEIACRVIRTARRMGIRTVAVYSDADAKALHVRMADEAVHIGLSPARESYLVGDKIIAAARATGAEAIHPGYGFLSENAEFAQAVIDAGLIWVGPKPDSIRAMGLKDAAKKLMDAAGVPTTPGYLGENQDPKRLQAEADKIGYPVLIKAVAGGGGKGMRRVNASAEFEEMLLSCKREAASSFGDDRVLIEKYVERPRHIEVQIFGDSHGNVVHLFERSKRWTTLPWLSPNICTSMWRGRSTYFSISTRSSPNEEAASRLQESSISSNSADAFTRRMPLPPPPATALISTG